MTLARLDGVMAPGRLDGVTVRPRPGWRGIRGPDRGGGPWS